MKKLLILLLTLSTLIFIFSFSSKNYDVKGKVIWVGSSCDFLIVETPRFFVIVENYYGKDIREDDILIGELHSYNFKEVYNVRKDMMQRIYIENYHNDKYTCDEWIKNNAKCK